MKIYKKKNFICIGLDNNFWYLVFLKYIFRYYNGIYV